MEQKKRATVQSLGFREWNRRIEDIPFGELHSGCFRDPFLHLLLQTSQSFRKNLRDAGGEPLTCDS